LEPKNFPSGYIAGLFHPSAAIPVCIIRISLPEADLPDKSKCVFPHREVLLSGWDVLAYSGRPGGRQTKGE